MAGVIKSTEKAVQLARNTVYNEMTEATQIYANEIQENLQSYESDQVLLLHMVGTLVSDMQEDPDKYGDSGIEQVAQYLNLEGGDTLLYAYAKFAATFTREFVSETMRRQTTHGRALTISHWIELSRVEKETSRLKLVDKVFDQNLSVRELQQEVRGNKLGNSAANRQGSTGRKPKISKSPIAATQQLSKMATSFRNFEALYSTEVLNEMESLPEEKLDQTTLDTLCEASESILELQLAVNDLVDNLSSEIDRIVKVTGIKPKGKKKAAKKGIRGK